MIPFQIPNADNSVQDLDSPDISSAAGFLGDPNGSEQKNSVKFDDISI